MIQMPILFALFSCLRSYQFDQAGAAFFWLPNMNEPDPTWILPVLVGLSSYLQSKISMAAQPPQAGQMRSMQITMLYVMPIMLGFMTRNFAAGLAIYWTTYNTLGFLMQIAINYIVAHSHEEMKKQIEDEQLREESSEQNGQKPKQRLRQRQKQNGKHKCGINPKSKISKNTKRESRQSPGLRRL